MTENRYENRLNKNNIKFNTLNPVWDNKTENALNVFEMIERLNEQELIIKELTQKKNDLKDLLVNSEPVLEQKELQKLIYKTVIDLIDEKIAEGNRNYKKRHLEAKIKNGDEEHRKEVSFILDTVFYWQGYVKSLEDLKKELMIG